MEFLQPWSDAAWAAVGWFWMALWAFVFGYLVSACIQVFVSRDRMQSLMGGDGVRSVSLATVFGFISSSCSFAAIVVVALVLHLGFGVVGWLPSPGAASILDREMFALDSTFALNLAAVLVTGVLAWLSLSTPAAGGPHHHGRGGVIEQGMKVVAPLAALWLAGGLVVGCFVG